MEARCDIDCAAQHGCSLRDKILVVKGPASLEIDEPNSGAIAAGETAAVRAWPGELGVDAIGRRIQI